MEELHAAIGRHLREQRLLDGSFPCTLCNQPVRGGQGLYHVAELRQARKCAYCHGASIHRAALGLAVRDWGPSATALPLCKHCGTWIERDTRHVALPILLSERVCADCRQPF